MMKNPIVGRLIRSRQLAQRRLQRLTCALKDRHSEMLLRLFVVLGASALLFSGCANTKSAAQTEPDSILREPENSSEVHGEVGLMYGASPH
jgi:hypothetical protein